MITSPQKLTLAIIAMAALSACDPQKPAIVGENEAAPAPSAESEKPTSSPSDLDVAKGEEIGYVFEAFLSPHQEPGEEKDTPGYIPKDFQSTGTPVLRKDRKSKGHGIVRFTKDLSRAYVDVKIEGVDPAEVNMFHIHCGRPDQLGPILVDFGLGTEIQENLKDGLFSFEVNNDDIVAESHAGHGLVGAFTAGCPIVPGQPDEVKTVAGMHHIARQGELYFNLHTKSQTYFGDIRGQLRPVGEYSQAEDVQKAEAEVMQADSTH